MKNIDKVILIGFNRSEILINNYKLIRSFYTGIIDLYIDGSRDDNLNDKIEQKKIKNFFNNCGDNKLLKNFSNRNRGCKSGVIHAISSGFKNSNFCLIIEDDCYVTKNFFELSSYFYGIDPNLNQLICSNCIFDDPGNLKYYYNHSFQAWGWACSKKVWSNFKILKNKDLFSFWSKEFKGNYFIKWNNFSRSLSSNHIDTWDYIFKTFIFKSKIKILSFNKLLVNNVGHDGGTHNTKANNLKLYDIILDNSLLEKIHYNDQLLTKHEKIDYFYPRKIFIAILSNFLYLLGLYRVGTKLYRTKWEK